MKNQTLKVEKYIDNSIKVGDFVKLIDGSGFTHATKKGTFYIINSYNDITGLPLNLQDIAAEVIECNINNHCCSGAFNTLYLQDIKVKIGNAEFRTASGFVEKLDLVTQTPEYSMEELINFVGFDFKIKK